MSEPKFTPGPWKLYNESHGVYVEPSIAWIGYGSAHTETEHKVNAALIAAAPDGYEYAETTSEVLQLLLNTYKLPDQARKCLQERIEQAEKYMKKARGENDTL